MCESKSETPRWFQYEGSSNNTQPFDSRNSPTVKMRKFYVVRLGW